MKNVKDNFIPALLQAFIICIVRFFTIPFQIWRGSLTRLAEQRKQSSASSTSDTEFPVLSWFKSAWDGVIVLSWVISLIVFVFLLFTAFNSYYPGMVITAALGNLCASYFAPIALSLTKEFLTLFLSMALNLEAIAGSKQKKGLNVMPEDNTSQHLELNNGQV